MTPNLNEILQQISQNRQFAAVVGVCVVLLVIFFVLFIRSLMGKPNPIQVRTKIDFSKDFLEELKETTQDAQKVINQLYEDLTTKEELIRQQNAILESQGELLTPKRDWAMFAAGIAIGVVLAGIGAGLYIFLVLKPMP